MLWQHIAAWTCRARPACRCLQPSPKTARFWHMAPVEALTAFALTRTCVLPGGGKGKNARALFLLFLDAVSVVASRRPAKQANASSGVDDLCAFTRSSAHCLHAA